MWDDSTPRCCRRELLRRSHWNSGRQAARILFDGRWNIQGARLLVSQTLYVVLSTACFLQNPAQFYRRFGKFVFVMDVCRLYVQVGTTAVTVLLGIIQTVVFSIGFSRAFASIRRKMMLNILMQVRYESCCQCNQST